MTVHVILYGSSCYDHRLRALGIGVHGYSYLSTSQEEGLSHPGDPSPMGYLDHESENKITVTQTLNRQWGHPEYTDSRRAIGALVLQNMFHAILPIGDISKVMLLVDGQTARQFNKIRNAKEALARAFWAGTKPGDLIWQNVMHTFQSMIEAGIIINVWEYSPNPDNKGRILTADLARECYRQAVHGFTTNPE